ncbi:MAG: hypothetical protein ACOCX2_11160 [Armatimonadota bacterium]
MMLMIVAMAAEGDGGGDDDRGQDARATDGGAGDDAPDPLADLTPEQQAAIDARVAKERDRLDMKYKSAAEKAREEARAEAEAEMKKQLEREQMDEVERLKAELAEERQARAQSEQEKEQRAEREAKLEAELARANYLAANAGDLPQAYRAMVQGDDDEALEESLTAAREQFEADFEAATGNKRSVGGGRRTTGEDNEPDAPPESELTPYQKQMRRLEGEA